MSSQVLTRYEAALNQVAAAKTENAKAQAEYERARGILAEAEAELAVARRALENKLSETKSAKGRKRAEAGISRTMLELIRAIPSDGPISFGDLEAALKLPITTIRSRLQKAKQAGLVENTQWGHYQLTPLGIEAQGIRVVEGMRASR